MQADHEQLQPQGQGSSSRRRWLVGVGCGLLMAAGTVIAGVLGSQAAQQRGQAAAGNKALPTDNILDTLAQLNALPQRPALRTKEEPVGTAAAAGSDGAATTTGTGAAADPGPVEGSTLPFQTLKDLINAAKAPTVAGAVFDPAPAGSLTTGGWAAIGSGRNTICYPINGTEVVQMSDAKSPCTIIMLTRSSREPYTIKQTMNITTPKIFVGNPIDMPALNSSKIERLFYVGPGGRLDVRAVTLYRGSGRRLDEGRLKLSVGTTTYVALGGSFTATGVLFRGQDQTVARVMEEMRHMLDWRSRNFGGSIFVAGGNLYLNGCTFIRVSLLGNWILNSAQVGRDLLVVAGNVVLSGCFNLNVNLFANNVVVGNTIAVLGGTAVWAGGATCNVAGVQAQWGAGIQMFVGGGVLVNAGFNYISANGGLMRGSFGLFSVGGGVHIQTGYVQSRAWGVGSVNNAGQTFSLGGGIHQMVGGATATVSIANIFNGAGGQVFVGSGQLRWFGVAQARAATAQSQYGAGLSMYNGAGTTNFILSPQVSAQVARAQFAAGNDIFLGAGWHTSINTTRYGAQLASSFYGVGNQIWVGAGGAVFIRCFTATRRGWGINSTPFTYTVAGTGVTRTQGQRNIVVTKNGLNVLPFQPSPMPKRALQQRVRTLTAAEEEAALATDSLAVQLLMGETVAKAGQNAFFNPEGRGKLLVVQSYMDEGKQRIVEDPALFQAPELKDVWGGLPMLLANRAAAGEDAVASGSAGSAVPKSNPGLISVNNTDCMLCSVSPGDTAAHQGGPDSCHVSDACAGADSPRAALQAALAAAPADFNINGAPGLDALPRLVDGSLELPDVLLLWQEVTVYCHSTDPAVPSASITDGCLSANYVKDVVRAFLGPEHQQDFQLAVASADLPAVVKPLVEEEGLLPAAMQPEWNPECQGWTKFNVYMTANEKAVGDSLAERWRAIVSDPSDFEATLLQNADAAAPVKPCSITVKTVGAATYPSIKNMKGFKPLTSGLAPVGPSVTVASDAAIAPVAEVAEGTAYKVYVQNFINGAKLSLQLVKGLDRSGPVVATIESFEDDGGEPRTGAGLTGLSWTPPAGLKALEQAGEVNKYYLKASVDSFPALFANSQAFTLKGAATGAAQ